MSVKAEFKDNGGYSGDGWAEKGGSLLLRASCGCVRVFLGTFLTDVDDVGAT